MGFSIIQAPRDVRYCAITKQPDAMRNPARPTNGSSMAGTYNKTLDLVMSSLVNPSGIQVPDVILNALDWLIVTDRLKTLLEKNTKADIEFLPFRLLNHKKRVAEERIYVVNVLGTIDCADRSRSKGTDSPFEKGRFFDCKALALVENKVPNNVKIFRSELFPPLIFVSDDLRAKIEEEKMIARFVAPGEPL
jgi:hypothetical protein